MTNPDEIIGPILFLDEMRDTHLDLAALFVTAPGERPGPIEAEGQDIAPERIADYDAGTVWRARFVLPCAAGACYRWNGAKYTLAADFEGDLRLAYVSCNGEETGDMERAASERNAMWARLAAEHERAPFALLLHGGDQLYADEVTEGHPLCHDWPDRPPRDPSRAGIADLRRHLRERFFARYAALYRAPQFAWLAARVPSIMQWDDHDICDGWGSLPRSRTYSPVGQCLFEAARESFLVFQHAARDGDLPARFTDPGGAHLGWVVRRGDLRIIAPDLRSERTRRRIMGDGGWRMMRAEATRAQEGQSLLMSSVPLLGPRLSLLEWIMVVVPRMQKYEDDLRDQWQSRAYRDEWKQMLRLVRDMAQRTGHDIAAISGEIHLATRAVMDLGEGLHLHQLVASGIAHRAPPVMWARTLDLLSRLGEDPLQGHPITIERIAGQRRHYVAERNYLVLSRVAGQWQAEWELEQSGRSAPLAIT
ncbi:MAG: alkaline phosphatase D family protein [Roseovarius sp.]